MPGFPSVGRAQPRPSVGRRSLGCLPLPQHRPCVNTQRVAAACPYGRAVCFSALRVSTVPRRSLQRAAAQARLLQEPGETGQPPGKVGPLGGAEKEGREQRVERGQRRGPFCHPSIRPPPPAAPPPPPPPPVPLLPRHFCTLVHIAIPPFTSLPFVPMRAALRLRLDVVCVCASCGRTHVGMPAFRCPRAAVLGVPASR